MTIRAIYTEQPSFPPTDNDPAASRVQLNGYWVDYTGTAPTLSDVQNLLNPPPTPEQARVAAIKANARRTAVLGVLTTVDDVGLLTAIANQYPSLTGDALKAVRDIYLVLMAVVRS